MYWFLHVGTFLILILLPRNGPKAFRDGQKLTDDQNNSSGLSNPNAVTTLTASQGSTEKEEISADTIPGSEEENHNKKLVEQSIENRELLLNESKKDL